MIGAETIGEDTIGAETIGEETIGADTIGADTTGAVAYVADTTAGAGAAATVEPLQYVAATGCAQQDALLRPKRRPEKS